MSLRSLMAGAFAVLASCCSPSGESLPGSQPLTCEAIGQDPPRIGDEICVAVDLSQSRNGSFEMACDGAIAFTGVRRPGIGEIIAASRNSSCVICGRLDATSLDGEIRFYYANAVTCAE